MDALSSRSSSSGGSWRESLDRAKAHLSARLIKLRELEATVSKKEAILRKLRGAGTFPWRSPIVVGVCAMEKKAKCKPMRAILGRLPHDEFEIKIFEEKVILEDPIECWPVCDCLIAFYSTGFPQAKVEAYVNLRKPFLVNDLESQRLLWDRRNVYKICALNDIPVPNHIIVDRDKDVPDEIIEGDDYIEVNGKRLSKPFVEKPVDADCHDVFIYYPKSSGGGRKELFRKIENRSSEFYPDRNNVRRVGSFIYEEFLTTEGTDVKVYAVTMDYAHAEARKSPVMDGRVMRDDQNVEIRYPVILSNFEKDLARKVVKGFKQNVCGFDMLRSGGRSYVCDVNGWSFVKRSVRYHKDTSLMLARLMRNMMGRPPPPEESDSESESDDDDAGDNNNKDLDTTNNSIQQTSSLDMLPPTHPGSADKLSAKRAHEELRAVIAIVRHGDRTPKQKLKMIVQDRRFMALFAKYGKEKDKDKASESMTYSVMGATPSPSAMSPPPPVRSPVELPELKLKTAKELGDVLRITNEILLESKNSRASSPVGELSDEDEQEGNDEIAAQMEALTQVRAVLEMHGTFRGINRKVQLRCTQTFPATGEPIEAQLILKWGGVLTPAGRERAEMLGRSFRERMYPGIDGLIRLHSTYRHDLKIYASDEGRVQVTAASFVKGLLDLEGHLTPILESLVKKGSDINVLLHDASQASSATVEAKQKLKTLLTTPQTDKTKAQLPLSVQRALQSLEPEGPIGKMAELHQEIIALVTQIKSHLKMYSKRNAQGLRMRGSITAAAFRGLKTRHSSSLADKPLHLDVSANSPFSSKITSHQQMAKLELPRLDHMASDGVTSDGGSVVASLGTDSSSRSLDLDTDDAKVDRGDGAVTMRDMFHLAHARWEKLQTDFFRKEVFDISKIPDIYDCAKYDITHNPEILKLQPRHLLRVYEISKHLADAVVPQEYGAAPMDKFEVGIKTCNSLLGKIRDDLRLAAEEGAGNDRMSQTDLSENGDLRSVSEAPSDDGGIVEGSGYRLDRRLAKSMGIKNANRHVRTRLYFTSESHLHAVMNVLRYAHLASGAMPKPADSALKRLADMSELSYLCHIVVRLFEVTELDGSKHHVVRVYVSDGISIKVIETESDVVVKVGTESTGLKEETENPTKEIPLHPSGFGFSSFHQNTGASAAASGSSSASRRGVAGGHGHHHHKYLPPADPLIPLWLQLPLNEAMKLFDPTLFDLVPPPTPSPIHGSNTAPASKKKRGFPLHRFESSAPVFTPAWAQVEETAEEEQDIDVRV